MALTHSYIADTARKLATDDKQAMPLCQIDIFNIDILRRRFTVPAVAVSAALDNDTVITLLKNTISHNDILCLFKIDAVRVVT